MAGVRAPASPTPAAEVRRDGVPTLAKDAQNLAPIAVVGDMAVEVADVDGVASPSEDDLQGTIKGQVALDKDYLLSQLREFIKSDNKKIIRSITFDPRSGAYKIEGNARIGRFTGPSFNVSMTADSAGRLVIRGHSWADWILRLFRQNTVTDWVEKSLKDYQAPIRTSRLGKNLFLEGIQNLTVPLGTENVKLTISHYLPMSGRGPFTIGPDGRILTALAGRIKGFVQQGKPTRPSDHPDRVALQVHFVARADRSISTRVTGSATLGITEEQLTALTGQRGEVLSPLVKSGRAHITDLAIDGTFTDKRRWDSRITGQAHIETPQGLTISTRFDSRVDDAGKAVDLTAGPVAYQDPFNGKQTIQKVTYRHDADGIRFDIADAPAPPVTVPFEPNRLGLLVGGDEYYEALIDVVGKAREGVMLESFGFPDGERPADLMETLLRKAGGLGPNGFGKPVQVRLLIDPGPFGHENWAGRVMDSLHGKGELNGKGASAWAQRFASDVRAGKGPYAAIPKADREQFLETVKKNLIVQAHPGGLARTNHRKVVVVDGVLGITGGVNVGDGHFSTVQDAMVPTVGPAVRDLAETFLRTWSENGGEISKEDRLIFLKDGATIAREGGSRFGRLVSAHASDSRILLTDDKQMEIESAYLEAIGQAKRSLKLEQQYLTERLIVDALLKAVRRGVDVTIVVPEDTGNEFELGNDLSILRLLEASALPGSGKVDLRYMHTRGDWTYHVHSKVLVADGKRALVGSANVDQRAMRGLAWTGEGRVLWNKELNLDVTDPAFARRVDAEMFGKDATRAESRDVWEKVASMTLQAAICPRDRVYERFHKGRPSAEAFSALADELKATYKKEANALFGQMGGTPSEAQAGGALVKALSDTNLYWDREWRLTSEMLDEARLAARNFKADPAGSEAKLRELQARMDARVAGAFPEGRGRDVEQHLFKRPFESLLAQLGKHPDDGAPWFVDHLAGAWAMATAHAALNPLEEAMGGVYRAGGMARHADTVRNVLRPDEQKARLSDAFNVLF